MTPFFLKVTYCALSFIMLWFPPLVAGNSSSDTLVRIVGSTAVFPFSALISERLSLLMDLQGPIIERTGTGAGINLFCGGMGDDFPDAVNTSRPLSPSQVHTGIEHGVKDLLEVKIGYDGIVVAHAYVPQDTFSTLTLEDLFKALSQEVLINGTWQKNPYTTWRDVNPSLPPLPLMIFGPPSTSGIRDSLKDFVLSPFCETTNPTSCGLIREDGVYIEMPENSMLIVQKLETNPDALGIIGYPFLDQNQDLLQGIAINSIPPTLSTILEGLYPLSRPLYFYVKLKNFQEKQTLQLYLQEFMSEDVSGKDGALVEKGLIPLKENEKAQLLEKVKALTS